MKVVVGTRGSNLALVQTNWVIEKLKEKYPEIEFEKKIIKTKGDKILNVALDKIGDKGLFVKEIEKELLEGTIDMAVHSMKDMPTDLTDGLVFSTTPIRQDRRDVFIFKEGINNLSEVPVGGKIGTGSKRRMYQLNQIRPDIKTVPIRGNIETRMKKIETENLDGVILAAAGIIRAGYQERISQYIDENEIVPAPAQGALALQYKESDDKIKEILESIGDKRSQQIIEAERAFLKGIEGSCHVPVGAFADIDEEEISIKGIYGDEEGNKLVRKTITGKLKEHKSLGKKLALEIIKEL